jgi:sugar O-acyltransferase (sialic acid O-acetyltransferase NeuD family)
MTKKKLIFLGGGDFCRELLWTVSAIPGDERGWEPFGVLDDNVDGARAHLLKRGLALPVLGSIKDHQPKSDEVFLPALGNPVHKLKASELMESRGGKFINLFHPTALIAPDAKLGTGIFAFMNTVISVGAQVEDFVSLNLGALIGHDAIIGRGCTLNPGSMVTGNVKLGRGVLLGSLSTIAPARQAGEFATVGAGSAVIAPVAAGVTVVGVPARAAAPPRTAAAGQNS